MNKQQIDQLADGFSSVLAYASQKGNMDELLSEIADRTEKKLDSGNEIQPGEVVRGGFNAFDVLTDFTPTTKDDKALKVAKLAFELLTGAKPLVDWIKQLKANRKLRRAARRNQSVD